MCGIAGFVTTGSPVDRPLLERMCGRILHRGPDDEGYYCSGGVGLGFRRLSIIDVAGGHQPLGNEDGSVQVVFNGEIYNYQELRKDLIARGHRFTTSSDTEVLVHLYEDVGEKLPEYLNGMFAFAIWDGRRSELFLARDRMGKKPLYYSTEVPGFRFCFASELKALTEIPGFPSQVNPHSVADFLSLSYVPDWSTIYKGANKLPAGHCLTLSPDGVRMRQYWKAEFAATPVRAETAAEQLAELCTDSVRRRIVSDVPLGAFLSGGVDSSAAVGLMAEAMNVPVSTFSIGFTSKAFDELSFARIAAQKHKTDHHEEVISPSVHDLLGELAQQFDEPFGDSSAIPMLSLSRMTRKHVTVALSGDGADELFGGYRRYYYGALEERLRSKFPAAWRGPVFGTAGRFYPKLDFMPQVFRAKSLLTNLAAETGDAYFNSMSTFRNEGLSRILSPELRNALNGYSPRDMFQDRFRRVRHLGPLEQMQAVDFETYLPGDILVKADRTTMAHSLEARSPWLDYRIVEFAAALPTSLKLHQRTGKYIFKHALRRFIPPEISQRRKMGFSVPLAEWLRTSLRPTFEETVFEPGMTEYLSFPEVRKIWSEHQSGLHNHDRKLWNLLMLACWRTQHQSKAGAASWLAEVPA